jgi:hypothetical protein
MLSQADDRLHTAAEISAQVLQKAREVRSTRPEAAGLLSDILGRIFGGGESSSPSTPSSVPELDPKSAGAALALLAGGVLLLNERRRRAAQQ